MVQPRLRRELSTNRAVYRIAQGKRGKINKTVHQLGWRGKKENERIIAELTLGETHSARVGKPNTEKRD